MLSGWTEEEDHEATESSHSSLVSSKKALKDLWGVEEDMWPLWEDRFLFNGEDKAARSVRGPGLLPTLSKLLLLLFPELMENSGLPFDVAY